MKQVWKKLIALAITATLAACGGTGTATAASTGSTASTVIQDVDNAVLVVSPIRRSYIQYEKYAEQLKAVLEKDGMIKIVVADGVPEEDLHDISLKKVNVNQARKGKLIEQTAVEMGQYVSQLRANDPELDVVEMVNIACRSLSSETGSKMMIIDSNLLGSKGYLNLTTQSLFEVDIESTVKKLKEGNHLPDLAGWKVKIVGLGEVNKSNLQPNDQMPLGKAERDYLKELYTAFFSIGCNTGEAPEFDDSNTKGEALGDDLPMVTPVDLSIPVSMIEVKEPEIVHLGVIDINEEIAKFEMDSAKLISDRSVVKQLLEPVATYLQEHPEAKIKVVGTTATWGDAARCKQLSLERAQAIADILKEYEGVSENNLIVIGAGYESILQKKDTDANGLVEEQAKKNRRVVIIGEGNDMYDQV